MRLPCVFYGDKGNSIRKPREKKRGENGDLLPLESFSLLSSCEDSNQERGRREGGGRWAREREGRGKEEGRESRRVTVRPSRSEGRAERGGGVKNQGKVSPKSCSKKEIFALYCTCSQF